MRSRTRQHVCGREIHGLTCRTWVHDPLKLLLALRGRLHVSSFCTQKRIAFARRHVIRRKRDPPEGNTRLRWKYGTRIFKHTRYIWYQIRRWTSWQFNRKATGNETRSADDDCESEHECGKAESFFVGFSRIFYNIYHNNMKCI